MPRVPSNQGIGAALRSPAAAKLAVSRRGAGGGTVHPGSKPGYTHITDAAQDRPAAIARAQAWSAETGKPVPPHLRFRKPLAPASPKPISSRSLDTPAQVRRARHKHGRRELARHTGYDPAVREQERVTRARRRARIRHAQHLLRQIVPAGSSLAKVRGGLGRRSKRVVESVYVDEAQAAVFGAPRYAGPGLGLAIPQDAIKIVIT